MTQDPQAMRAEIDARRDDLTRDVDALNDKVNPTRVVSRNVDAVKGRASRLRESVMGGSGSNGPGVGDRASDATSAVGDRTRGNPLAAGLVAFGAGMLLSALLPASESEAKATQKLVDAAKDHGVVDEVKQAGQDTAQGLKEHARSAAQDVAGSAQDSARHVADEARSGAQSAADQARS
ncbi:DUF3618 domain-containing protein [Solicola sp. PLA-1-18]|uniref:DUF3618 domain-containing protein n=1 Tax=Solicola sp. PLA-1-18 TaxID=3380532 RepID=UPI003B77DCD8